MKEKRDRNEVKINQQRHYDELADATPSKKARERFRRKPYQAPRLIIAQGQQMERGRHGENKTAE